MVHLMFILCNCTAPAAVVLGWNIKMLNFFILNLYPTVLWGGGLIVDAVGERKGEEVGLFLVDDDKSCCLVFFGFQCFI